MSLSPGCGVSGTVRAPTGAGGNGTGVPGTFSAGCPGKAADGTPGPVGTPAGFGADGTTFGGA
jgi:hypothetical protein